MTPAEHALPPDNFQETPKPVVAHRTSPTNIGLYLLSTVAARDFGWLGTLPAVERLEGTLTTMGQMELCRGHFYNWYDTQDLRPLEPRYVSTVDSGNLAGHLLTLANASREFIEKSTLGPQILAGMEDSIRLLREGLAEMGDAPRTHLVTRKHLANAIDIMAASLDSVPLDAVDWAIRMVEWKAQARTIADIAQAFEQELGNGARSELSIWSAALSAALESHARDAQILIPWTRLDVKQIARMAQLRREHAPDWLAIEPFLHSVPTLADAPDRFDAALGELAALRARLISVDPKDADTIARIDALSEALLLSAADAASLIRRLSAIAQTAERIFQAMEFGFLFDETRKLFSIGYRLSDASLDPNCYDLLASEARLASFIAIAKGEVPASHWFRLGRALTPVGLSLIHI